MATTFKDAPVTVRHDALGDVPCDNAPECDQLVDEYRYETAELNDDEALVLCDVCLRWE